MINHKTFQLNKEWTTIFYPEQPSGFAIMLLGGDKHYINENANLEIVDASSFNNMVVEEYEFIGDRRLIKKIEEAYYSKKIVDNTFVIAVTSS